jgi:hypothetical protein
VSSLGQISEGKELAAPLAGALTTKSDPAVNGVISTVQHAALMGPIYQLAFHGLVLIQKELVSLHSTSSSQSSSSDQLVTSVELENFWRCFHSVSFLLAH